MKNLALDYLKYCKIGASCIADADSLLDGGSLKEANFKYHEAIVAYKQAFDYAARDQDKRASDEAKERIDEAKNKIEKINTYLERTKKSSADQVEV